MSDVLSVSAGELSDPRAFLVFMEANDRLSRSGRRRQALTEPDNAARCSLRQEALRKGGRLFLAD